MMVSLLAVGLALLGLLLPFWGFVCIALIIAVVAGNWPLALTLGVCADILYGHPVGMLHVLAIPFTLGAIVLLSTRYFFMTQMRDQGQNRL